MAQYLRPRNKSIETFLIGHSAWNYLLNHAGLMWPVVFQKAKWYMVTGLISRMPLHDTYPRPLEGPFRVYAGEAKHLARVARNLAEMNKTVEPRLGQKNFKVVDGKFYTADEPVFETFREDWNDLFLRFADWAEQSGGFRI